MASRVYTQASASQPMKAYLEATGKLHTGGGTRLVLRKLKGQTPYNESRSPVTASSAAVSRGCDSWPTEVQTGALRAANGVESCRNSFISGLTATQKQISRDTISPVGRMAARVKGTCSVVQRYQNVYRIYSRESQVYQCDFFRLMYYPPDHFVALFRKSKPAINIRTVGQIFLNGNVLDSGGSSESIAQAVFNENSKKNGFTKVEDVYKKLSSLFQSNPSTIPSNYAFLRRQLRITLKKCFIDEWCRLRGASAVQEAISSGRASPCSQLLDDHHRTLPGVAKDGYYSYQVLIFPDRYTVKEFEASVKKSVQIVANLDWDDYMKPHKPSKANEGKSWVQIANERVRVDSLNKLLSGNEIPLAVEKVPL